MSGSHGADAAAVNVAAMAVAAGSADAAGATSAAYKAHTLSGMPYVCLLRSTVSSESSL